jgi:hypothetical protein
MKKKTLRIQGPTDDSTMAIELPMHMAQQWRLQWIRYWLTFEHRPACVEDVYGITIARQREQEDKATKQPATEKGKALFAILQDTGFSNIPSQIVGPANAPSIDSVKATHDLRAVWNIKTGTSMVDTALDYAGIKADVTIKLDETPSE